MEEYYKKGITSPSEREAAFLDFVRICKSKYIVTTAYCDSAEQTLIQGLKTAALREGVGIIVRNAQKGPINERIRAYCILMGSDRYKIMRRCKPVSYTHLDVYKRQGKYITDQFYREILRLDRMLCNEGIPHVLQKHTDGWQIIYPKDGEERIMDAIENFGSYGSDKDLLEIMGLLTPEE